MRNWPWPTKKMTAINCIRSCHELYINYSKKEGVVWLVGLFSWRVCKIFIVIYTTSTNDSSRRNRWMSIQWPSCFFNLWSSCSSRQSSAGGTAYSRLLWPDVLPRRPQRPLLLPPLARASLYSPTPPVILRRRQPHTAAGRVNPHTPLWVGIHCRVFPSSASSPS